MTTATGMCPVCKREMRLKADGTLRHHGGDPGTGVWDHYRSYRCAGAGQRPAGNDTLGASS